MMNALKKLTPSTITTTTIGGGLLLAVASATGFATTAGAGTAGSDLAGRTVMMMSATAKGGDAPATIGTSAGDPNESTIDADIMFERLVERYRTLSEYEDEVRLEQITSHGDESQRREETRVLCTIDTEGNVSIVSPQEHLAGSLGVGALWRSSPLLQRAAREYDLWIAPHLGLRVHEQPLHRFRAGIEEGFTPVKAEAVTIDEEEFVRLDLQSGDGLSSDHRARFELFIHPDTMLITRIRGTQLLPDGGEVRTDFTITPRRVVNREGVDMMLKCCPARTTT